MRSAGGSVPSPAASGAVAAPAGFGGESRCCRVGRQAAGDCGAGSIEHDAVHAGVEHQTHRAAEEGQRRAVAPVDAGGLQARRALALVGKLAQHPAGLVVQRGLDLRRADPARRGHRQPVGADREADAAPARAAQAVGDELALKANGVRRAAGCCVGRRRRDAAGSVGLLLQALLLPGSRVAAPDAPTPARGAFLPLSCHDSNSERCAAGSLPSVPVHRCARNGRRRACAASPGQPTAPAPAGRDAAAAGGGG